MHKNARDQVAKLGAFHKETPMGACLHAAYEPEIDQVVPSILKANLKKAGYHIDVTQRKNGVTVEITQRLDKLLEEGHRTAVDFMECETRDPKANKPDPATRLPVARAYSFSENDAILQAVHAELKELGFPPEEKDKAPGIGGHAKGKSK